jgi:hypothetical protein
MIDSFVRKYLDFCSETNAKITENNFSNFKRLPHETEKSYVLKEIVSRDGVSTKDRWCTV